MTWIEWKESGTRSFSKSIKGMPEGRRCLPEDNEGVGSQDFFTEILDFWLRLKLTDLLEFAKQFLIHDRNWSPVSIKMIRSARHSVAWLPVCSMYGVRDLRLTLRLRGAGYRRYSMSASHKNPSYNRHWFRHILVALSPPFSNNGVITLPF